MNISSVKMSARLRLICFAVVASATMFVAGCETARVQTVSGNPEVTMVSQDLDAVKSYVVDAMLTNGFALQRDSQFSATFAKELSGAGGILYQAVLGNANNTTPQVEVTVNFAKLPTTIRVMATYAITMQNAFGQTQRNTSANPGLHNNLQATLENVKARVEGIVAIGGESQGVDSAKPLFQLAGFENVKPRESANIKILRGEEETKKFLQNAPAAYTAIAHGAFSTRPRNEQASVDTMRIQAASLGADLLCVFTDETQLERVFPGLAFKPRFGAIAYHRQDARIGMRWKPTGANAKTGTVDNVVPNSAAQAAGIQIGEIVQTIDGVSPIPDSNVGKRAVNWQPGDSIRVVVIRSGLPVELTLTLTGPTS